MERFALPDGLEGLSNEELSALDNLASERLTALRGTSNPTQADVDELAAIKQYRSSVKELRAARATFSADLAELDTPVPVPEVVVPEPEVVPEPDPAPVAETEPVEPVTAAAEPVSEPEATVTRPVNTAIPEAPSRPAVVITASADIPQVALGAELDLDGVANAIYNKSRAFRSGNRVIDGRYPVATVHKQIDDVFDLRGKNDNEVMRILDELATTPYSEAVTASGGWCAPSETLYDLYETICGNPQLFSLPTFRADRGGVRWPIFQPIDFTQTVDWIWTEADDIAATGTKPCIRIECNDFQECRLDAHGVCVELGNFMDRGYPEQVRWALNRVFYLHDRAESLRQLLAVIADADAATIGATFGAASAIVAALLLQVQAYRDRNGLCQGATVEAVAPAFLKEAIRADIARQDFGGVGNANLVSDATIRAWFMESGVSIRFIDFWQALTDAAPGPLTWPTTVDIFFYTPGTYVRFDGGTLDLGITRDSVLNSTNDYNIFTEDFYCLGRRGPRGVNVTIPICPTGEVGGRNPSSGEVVCPLA